MWKKAVENCDLKGMKLLSIETEEESKCIHKLKTDYGNCNIQISNKINANLFMRFTEQEFTSPDSGFWVSGKLTNKAKKEWTWTSTGQKFDYTNWSKGQPDNFLKMGEECLQIPLNDKITQLYNLTSMQWNDLACHFQMFYICE